MLCPFFGALNAAFCQAAIKTFLCFLVLQEYPFGFSFSTKFFFYHGLGFISLQIFMVQFNIIISNTVQLSLFIN